MSGSILLLISLWGVWIRLRRVRICLSMRIKTANLRFKCFSYRIGIRGFFRYLRRYRLLRLIRSLILYRCIRKRWRRLSQLLLLRTGILRRRRERWRKRWGRRWSLIRLGWKCFRSIRSSFSIRLIWKWRRVKWLGLLCLRVGMRSLTLGMVILIVKLKVNLFQASNQLVCKLNKKSSS